jgi:hypothetical protein
MGKRAKGEGTGPFWSEARQKWVVQLSAGPDGRRPLRTADTEAEALALKKQMETQRAAGRSLARKTETVGDLLDTLLETTEVQGRRPATIKGYRHRVAQLKDVIGAVKAKEVDYDRVQRLANTLARTLTPLPNTRPLSALAPGFSPARVSNGSSTSTSDSATGRIGTSKGTSSVGRTAALCGQIP